MTFCGDKKAKNLAPTTVVAQAVTFFSLCHFQSNGVALNSLAFHWHPQGMPHEKLSHKILTVDSPVN